ncbi:MAG: hypothetical protein H0W15_02865 [Gemmatimonadales bacterium]|nr:hypothetical protein [Gemmatimonadales bacterium]
MPLLLLVAVLLGSGAPVMQSPTTRWAIEVRGPATIERGELRLNGSAGQLLMESADSAYVALRDVVIDSSRVQFTSPAGNRRFEGVRTGDAMQGVVHEADGRVVPWRAEVIAAGTERWPVRPRVIVRQLDIGSSAGVTSIPAVWHASAPTPRQILVEYDSLARSAGIVGATGFDLIRRSQRLALGFDRPSRDAVRNVLERIARGPAADGEFTRIFRGPGGLRLDLHEVAVQAARMRAPEFGVDAANRALVRLQLVVPGNRDTIATYEGAWRLWSRMGRDSARVFRQLDSLALTDVVSARDIRALLAGYTDASRWWIAAVAWLMTHRWLERDDGTLTSPVDLVSGFWGKASLPLPAIEPTRFGGVQAVPVVGGSRLGVRLVRPGNASAAEWLAHGGVDAALRTWHDLDADDSIVLDMGGMSARVTTPAAVARGRLGGFLGAQDAIRIEPGIMPVLAVATLIHEWQHLLFEGARLEGAGWGVVESGRWLRILDSDPWLGEGAAEWATEVTLEPVHRGMPMFAFMEAEKRSGIALASNDDPHVLGYLLVRALAQRADNAAQVRDQLLRHLHDPAALAAASGWIRSDGAPALTLSRPVTRAVIPEITFTWDDGVAEFVQRRLIVPFTQGQR